MTRELFLYTRTDCAPCREMKSRLQHLLAGRDCVLRVIDIEGDAELENLYGTRVPVLVAGNREICQYRLDSAAVMSFLGC